jgi:hypothetical protein
VAVAGAEPSAGSEATWLFCGALGNCDGSVLAGPEGGGNWLDVTWPDGAACKGSGRVESMEEKRVLEHPLAKSAVSARVIRPVFETIMPTSATLDGRFFDKSVSYQHG